MLSETLCRRKLLAHLTQMTYLGVYKARAIAS